MFTKIILCQFVVSMEIEIIETKKIVAQVPIKVKAEFSKQAILANKSEGELAAEAITDFLGKKEKK